MRTRLLFLALVISIAITAQTGGYPFRIKIVNSVTGAPIPGANIAIDGASNERVSGRTDAGGLFSGRFPSIGKQMLTATRRGYLMTGGGAMGKLIDIQAGAAENNLTIEMLPLGVIAGRVLDQYGDPVREVIVRDLKNWKVAGQGEYYEGSGAATTDDRGEFRLADVEPGKVYVAAEYNDDQIRRVTQSRLRWPEIGGFVLFPDTTDIGHAEPVEVHPGATTRVNDMHLHIQRAVTVSGHVKPLSGSHAFVNLHRAGVRLGLNIFAVQGGHVSGDGSFNRTVLPGRYILSASDQNTGKLSREVTIEVHDKDVSNIEIVMDLTYEINGRIVIDGPGVMDFSKVNLNFLGAPAKLAPDGSFHANAFDRKVQYMLQGIPEGWYVKDVTAGGRHLNGTHFEVTPGNNEILVTLSPRGARVEITLPNTGGVLDAADAVLLPENGPLPDVENAIHATPQQSGKLIAHSVPPGIYRVFALDATNWVLLFDLKTLMEKYAKSAPLIDVSEGEQKSIVVPLTKIQPE